MDFKSFVSGLNILLPNYERPSEGQIDATDHQFFAPPTDAALCPEDVSALKALGWLQENNPSDYDPKIGWTAFS